MWEVWQCVKLLCKHVHNKWHMSSEPIVEFKLHKNQHRKTPFIFHVACTMPISRTQGGCKQAPKMLSLDTTFWSKDSCQKVEPCLLLHLISLSTCYKALTFTIQTQRFPPHPPTRFC